MTDTSTALAAFNEDDAWAQVPDEIEIAHIGISLPRLRPDMRPGGGWIDETDPDNKRDSIKVIVLAAKESRAWWRVAFGDSDGNLAPDCRSADMERPDPNSPDRQSDTCSRCPHSQWQGSEAPACAPRAEVLVFDVENQRVAMTSFSGTGVKHWKSYVARFRSSVPRRPPMSVVTEISTSEVSRDGMRWLEPTFKVVEDIPFQQAAGLISLRDQLKAEWEARIAELLGTDGVAQPPPATAAAGYEPFGDDEPAEAELLDENGDSSDLAAKARAAGITPATLLLEARRAAGRLNLRPPTRPEEITGAVAEELHRWLDGLEEPF